MNPPAGWFPDARQPNTLRWWDGSAWTEHTAPMPQVAPPAPSAPSGGFAPPAGPSATEFAVPGADEAASSTGFTAPAGPPMQVAPPLDRSRSGAVAPGHSPLGGPRADGPAVDTDGPPLWKRWWAIVGVLVLLVGAIAILVPFATGGDDDASDATREADADAATDSDDASNVDATNDDVPDDDVALEDTAFDDTTSDGDTESDDTTDESDADPDAPDDADADPDPGPAAEGAGDGSTSNPFPFSTTVPVTWSTFGDADGSVWNTTISEPRDIGADVAAENQFNEPPPDGVVFLGFDVEMALVEADTEPLSQSLNFSWEVLGGSTSAVYDSSTIETESFGCGVVPGEFPLFAEAFVGGRLFGTICIPVPEEDVGDPATRVALNFFGDDRIVFAADGEAGALERDVPVPTVTPADGTGEVGSRTNPLAYDNPTDVTFDAFGDADGSVWTTTIGAPRDISADVAAENQFNDPPPAGTAFVGFEVTMTLVSADVEPLSPGFDFQWEILGGESGLVYDAFSITTGCGVIADTFDARVGGDLPAPEFSELFAGGTLTGVVCIPLPLDDLDHPGTSVAMDFTEGLRVVFQS